MENNLEEKSSFGITVVVGRIIMYYMNIDRSVYIYIYIYSGLGSSKGVFNIYVK